jgi:hypothetical protein
VARRHSDSRARTRPCHGVTLLVLALLSPLMVAVTPAEPGRATQDTCAGTLCAGAASVDTTWHTGAGQGQLGGPGNHVSEDRFDPYHHTTKMSPTDGIQSRTHAKSVVLQGPDGTKAAYVKTEVYLQQDILWQRVAQLVTGGDPANGEYAVPGLEPEAIMLGGTHNHSAPHYTSTAWGVWIFADVLDLRAFDHTAKGIAASIREAADDLRPATVGAAVVEQDGIQQNILGPATADDGSPAGFPRDHVDPELSVVRIDEADTGDPIAAIVNFAMHPESIDGAGLISSDFTGIVERDVERWLGRAPGAEHGPVVAWSQGGLGDVEPDRSRANPPEDGREYWRRNFSQAELMSRELTETVTAAWEYAADPGTGAQDERFVADKHVPMTDDAPVDAVAYRVPGPPAHPAPTVSNCRTERPGIPVVGFPDCERGGFEPPEAYGQALDAAGDAGVPVPENYGVPSHGAVQEALTLHLQTIRIGEVLLATCPCEPITDMALNFKTRADATDDNQHLGHEPTCEETDHPDVYSCAFENHAWQDPDWHDVDRDAVERMRAQVRNDAAGWDDDPAHLGGEAEPSDPDEIRGNFTHDELGGQEGFTLPLMMATANDHVGYVVTYREHERGDHYRKALNPFGPRTADLINTRLLAMARELRGGPGPDDAYELVVGSLDEMLSSGKAMVLGAGSEVATDTYETVLPDDGGEPGRVLEQPASTVEHFGAATFTWEGGSNYTDNPTARVQRLVVDDDASDEPGRPGPPHRPGRPGDGGPSGAPGASGHAGLGAGSADEGDAEPRWETVATPEGGEVVVSLDFSSWGSEAPAEWAAGEHFYPWTATFEVFEATPPGRYRFVVEGEHRTDGEPGTYAAASEPFDVDLWHGIAVDDLVVTDDSAGFTVAGVEADTDVTEIPGPVEVPATAIRYPFTHDSAVGFVDHAVEVHDGRDGRPLHRYCFTCTFRPWASHGEVDRAEVTVHRADGSTTTHDAIFDDATDRWVADGLTLAAGDTVTVEPGGVVDEHGNLNGERATP